MGEFREREKMYRTGNRKDLDLNKKNSLGKHESWKNETMRDREIKCLHQTASTNRLSPTLPAHTESCLVGEGTPSLFYTSYMSAPRRFGLFHLFLQSFPRAFAVPLAGPARHPPHFFVFRYLPRFLAFLSPLLWPLLASIFSVLKKRSDRLFFDAQMFPRGNDLQIGGRVFCGCSWKSKIIRSSLKPKS